LLSVNSAKAVTNAVRHNQQRGSCFSYNLWENGWSFLLSLYVGRMLSLCCYVNWRGTVTCI